ncbi:gp067 [Rhodococcus phage ReqiDocB7]|uniref:gp067 n=1 Tax=Rhodococcus phage ReqiDocB7 TaxID=691966 RepID=UPI0001CDD85C|nr:gp067 [Rhodococcus phage ReqiDocB7]ADD80853.1 gp067 [Rhodococcus phage ReqiDocB7]
MTTAESILNDLEDFKGKICTIVLRDDEGNEGEAKEYQVVEANGGMYILREKGKSATELVTSDRIADWKAPERKPAKLRAKRLNPVTAENVKRHLLDNHAYRVADINELSSEDALDLHNEIDHEGLDLGHFHDVSRREKAIAEAGADPEAEDLELEDESEDIEGTEYDEDDPGF